MLKSFLFVVAVILPLSFFVLGTILELTNYVVSCIKQQKLIPIREAVKKYRLTKETVFLIVLYTVGACAAIWIAFLGGYTKEDVKAIREEEYQLGYEVGFDEGYSYGYGDSQR